MLEAPLTARAQADRDWLAKRLGDRLRPPVRSTWVPETDPPTPCWEITILLGDGGAHVRYADTLEKLYARVRRETESALAQGLHPTGEKR